MNPRERLPRPFLNGDDAHWIEDELERVMGDWFEQRDEEETEVVLPRPVNPFTLQMMAKAAVAVLEAQQAGPR